MTRRAQKVVTRRCPRPCATRGCGLTGHYEVSRGRKLCALHGAITLLARVVGQALAAENNAKGGR